MATIDMGRKEGAAVPLSRGEHHSAKFHGDQSKRLPSHSDVSMFNMKAVCHLGFSSSEKVLENPR